MSTLLLTFATFFSAVLIFIAVYSIVRDLFLRDRNRVSKRIDDEFRKKQRDKIRKSVLFKDLTPLALEAANQEVRKKSLPEKFALVIEQSGLNITPRRVFTIMVLFGLGVGMIAGLIRQSFLIAGVAALIAASLPWLYVVYKRKMRLDKLMAQLPDAFDLMARVIRAGQTMSQAIQAVADEFDQPIAEEFTYCYEQQNLGLPSELALRDLARRTGILEVRVFVVGLLVQQQTGGNLAEMLDKLADIIRERFKLRGKIQALTAEGRFQAVILLALPPLVLVMFMFVHPLYISAILTQPALLMGMLIAEIIGAIWIRQIVNFDF